MMHSKQQQKQQQPSNPELHLASIHDIAEIFRSKERGIVEKCAEEVERLEALVKDRDEIILDIAGKYDNLKNDFLFNLEILRSKDAEIGNLESMILKKNQKEQALEETNQSLSLEVENLQKKYSFEVESLGKKHALEVDSLQKKYTSDVDILSKNCKDVSEKYQEEKQNNKTVLSEIMDSMETLRRASEDGDRFKKTEIERLTYELKHLKTEKEEIVELQRREMTLSFNAALQDKEGQFAAKEREITDKFLRLESAFEFALKENKALKVSLNDLRELYDTCKLELATTIETYRSELSTTTEANRQLNYTLMEIRKETSFLEQANSELERSKSELERNNNEVKCAGDIIEEELADVKRQLVECRQECNYLQENNSQKEKELFELKDLNNSNNRIVGELKSSISLKSVEIVDVKGKRDKAILELSHAQDMHKEENALVQMEKKMMEEKIVQLKESLEKMTVDMERTKKRLYRLEGAEAAGADEEKSSDDGGDDDSSWSSVRSYSDDNVKGGGVGGGVGGGDLKKSRGRKHTASGPSGTTSSRNNSYRMFPSTSSKSFPKTMNKGVGTSLRSKKSSVNTRNSRFSWNALSQYYAPFQSRFLGGLSTAATSNPNHSFLFSPHGIYPTTTASYNPLQMPFMTNPLLASGMAAAGMMSSGTPNPYNNNNNNPNPYHNNPYLTNNHNPPSAHSAAYNPKTSQQSPLRRRNSSEDVVLLQSRIHQDSSSSSTARSSTPSKTHLPFDPRVGLRNLDKSPERKQSLLHVQSPPGGSSSLKPKARGVSIYEHDNSGSSPSIQRRNSFANFSSSLDLKTGHNSNSAVKQSSQKRHSISQNISSNYSSPSNHHMLSKTHSNSKVASATPPPTSSSLSSSSHLPMRRQSSVSTSDAASLGRARSRTSSMTSQKSWSELSVAMSDQARTKTRDRRSVSEPPLPILKSSSSSSHVASNAAHSSMERRGSLEKAAILANTMSIDSNNKLNRSRASSQSSVDNFKLETSMRLRSNSRRSRTSSLASDIYSLGGDELYDKSKDGGIQQTGNSVSPKDSSSSSIIQNRRRSSAINFEKKETMASDEKKRRASSFANAKSSSSPTYIGEGEGEGEGDLDGAIVGGVERKVLNSYILHISNPKQTNTNANTNHVQSNSSAATRLFPDVSIEYVNDDDSLTGIATDSLDNTSINVNSNENNENNKYKYNQDRDRDETYSRIEALERKLEGTFDQINTLRKDRADLATLGEGLGYSVGNREEGDEGGEKNKEEDDDGEDWDSDGSNFDILRGLDRGRGDKKRSEKKVVMTRRSSMSASEGKRHSNRRTSLGSSTTEHERLLAKSLESHKGPSGEGGNRRRRRNSVSESSFSSWDALRMSRNPSSSFMDMTICARNQMPVNQTPSEVNRSRDSVIDTSKRPMRFN